MEARAATAEARCGSKRCDTPKYCSCSNTVSTHSETSTSPAPPRTFGSRVSTTCTLSTVHTTTLRRHAGRRLRPMSSASPSLRSTGRKAVWQTKKKDSLKRERRVRLELCSPAGQQRTGGRIRMGWRAGRRAYGAAVSALGYPGGPRARGSRLGGAGAGRDAPSGTCGMIGTTSWSALCLLQSSERAEDAPCAWPSRSPTARSASDGSEPAHLLNLHGWRLRAWRRGPQAVLCWEMWLGVRAWRPCTSGGAPRRRGRLYEHICSGHPARSTQRGTTTLSPPCGAEPPRGASDL